MKCQDRTHSISLGGAVQDARRHCSNYSHIGKLQLAAYELHAYIVVYMMDPRIASCIVSIDKYVWSSTQED